MAINLSQLVLMLLLMLLLTGTLRAAEPNADALRKAVSFYASFDDAPQGDVGGGDRSLWTRSDHPTEKGQYVYGKGFDAKVFRIAKDRGIQGGALECTGEPPRNGMLFFPAQGKLAFKPGGWGGAISVWLYPHKQTPFCDPVYITQKRWNDGGIWFDFNKLKQYDLRMGTFPALAKGQAAPQETDPGLPWAWVKENALKVEAWNHVVLTWTNFDTGRKDGRSAIYVDGKLVGEVTGRDLAMKWDLEKTRIYLVYKYQGLVDELALFNRGLTAEEVSLLKQQPNLLAGLKKAGE